MIRGTTAEHRYGVRAFSMASVALPQVLELITATSGYSSSTLRPGRSGNRRVVYRPERGPRRRRGRRLLEAAECGPWETVSASTGGVRHRIRGDGTGAIAIASNSTSVRAWSASIFRNTSPTRGVTRSSWATTTSIFSTWAILALYRGSDLGPCDPPTESPLCDVNLAQERDELHGRLRGIQTPKDDEPLHSESLAAEATEAVANATLPAAIIEAASGRIMAASPPMREMFASGAGVV